MILLLFYMNQEREFYKHEEVFKAGNGEKERMKRKGKIKILFHCIV